MNNPLLNTTALPQFSQIRPEHIEPAVDYVMSQNRSTLIRLLERQSDYTWENLMQPLEEMGDALNRVWSAVRHLNAVVNSEELRSVYNACLPKITVYSTELGQNVQLFKAVSAIADSPHFQTLTLAQQKVIEHELRDFRLAGVHLSDEDKQRFSELNQTLSQLTTQFEENLLDATQGWSRLVTDANELAGIPEHAVALARQAAENKKVESWLFTLEMPSFHAVITYADSSELRREMYHAYVTRASDQGPTAGQWDNSNVMQAILKTRTEMAKLIGFANFAECSLATKMAKTPTEVLEFLNELGLASLDKAKQEFTELKQFAEQHAGITDLNPWDVGYFSEKFCQQRYSISEEELRPYFPEDHVLTGMFTVIERLYDMRVVESKEVDAWHKDVRLFAIFDNTNQLRGQFYIDLYARTNKRGGAWMDDCVQRRKLANGDIQTPVAFLVCNFNAPVADNPALFTHDEVLTLFHEFGHGLQHMLTTVDYANVSGINGIPWDAVEIASQFMENWCWQKEGLDLIAKHYKSGQPLPDELFNNLHRAKNFQSAMQMVRQLEFALFDFRLHLEYDPHQLEQIQTILNEVRAKTAVMPATSFNRFQHSFSHIFAGGYAAGYYSYKWAEVLACDAFAKFEETGIFNQKTGNEFLNTFLEQGGTVEPMALFIQFRGRKPNINALLKQSGIA